MPGLCDQDIKENKGHAQLKEVVRQISDVLKILGNSGRCRNALQYHEQRYTDGLDVDFSRAWRLYPFRFLEHPSFLYARDCQQASHHQASCEGQSCS